LQRLRKSASKKVLSVLTGLGVWFNQNNNIMTVWMLWTNFGLVSTGKAGRYSWFMLTIEQQVKSLFGASGTWKQPENWRKNVGFGSNLLLAETSYPQGFP
jgi:hypothetical protein